MKNKQIQRKNNQAISSGFSLLEMVVAAALVTGTLVPALAVIRDSMSQSRELHRRKLLANYSVRILEERAAIAATNWVNSVATGNFSADGHNSIRYTWMQSDAPSNGGLTGQLMNIEVWVYDDENNDSTMNTGELVESYRTKVAKLNSYENEEQ